MNNTEEHVLTNGEIAMQEAMKVLQKINKKPASPDKGKINLEFRKNYATENRAEGMSLAQCENKIKELCFIIRN